MRKLFTLFAAILCTASMWADVAVNGKLPGAFSVSATKVVYFSQGNLHATTTDLGTNWTWSFAENQYDYIGNATANNAINGNGSVSTNGTVDMFAWSTANTYYGIHNDGAWATYHGDFIDWGTNVITNGGNEANAWRTLTQGEWDYLLNTRTTSARIRKPNTFSTYTDNARYTKATILTDGSGTDGLTFNIVGTILFPDNFNSNVTYSGVSWGMANSISSLYPTTCTTAGWAALEEAGCVFLPAAGYRSFAHVYSGGSASNYWSATPHEDEAGEAYYLLIGSSTVQVRNTGRLGGKAVRLVSETAPPTPATVSTPPTAIDGLEYTGAAQALLNNDGAAEGGTLNYSLDNSTWSSSIPTATNAGDYTVYYMVVGDASHADFTPTENSIAVSIEKADVSYTAPTAITGLMYNGEEQTLATAGSATGGEMQYKLGDGAWSADLPTAEAIGDHTVYYKVAGDANHTDVAEASFVVNIAAVTVLYENADPTVTLTGLVNAGEAYNITMNRTVYAMDYYNTICLPFAVSASDLTDPSHPLYGYSQLMAFDGAEVTGSGQNIFINVYVKPADHIEAGIPYFISYPSSHGDIVNPIFPSVTCTETQPGSVTKDGVTFQGMFGPEHITTYAENVAAGSHEDYLFLGSNNRLLWPNDDGTSMRGFRAYFILHRDYIPASHAPRGTSARIVTRTSTTTDIEGVQMPSGRPFTDRVQKVIENGMLYIIRNGVKYDAQGKMVK